MSAPAIIALGTLASAVLSGLLRGRLRAIGSYLFFDIFSVIVREFFLVT